MDRTTSAQRRAEQPKALEYREVNKSEVRLGDLHPNQKIEIATARSVIYTTPRELIRMARMPSWLTLDQVEKAFAPPRSADDKVVPIWRQRLPNGRR